MLQLNCFQFPCVCANVY